MDKAEYQSRLEELNSLVRKEDYEGALQIVESIEWRRVKSVRTLSMVADIYEANKMYPEAHSILLMAYERSAVGKGILYRLVEVSVKMKDFDGAMEYYNEFEEIARNDSSKYLLKYKILRGQKAPLEQQIRVLEEYKDREFTERWAYELAALYAKAGDEKKCIEVCDDLILWFSEGRYVTKAMELKMQYEPLTLSQKKKYESRVSGDEIQESPRLERTPMAETAVTREPERKKQVEFPSYLGKTINFQEELAKSIRDVFPAKANAQEKQVREEIAAVKEPEEEKVYEVKDLEPEKMEIHVNPGPNAQTTIKTRPEPKEKPAPSVDMLDLDALFRETASGLSEAVAAHGAEDTEHTNPKAQETEAQPETAVKLEAEDAGEAAEAPVLEEKTEEITAEQPEGSKETEQTADSDEKELEKLLEEKTRQLLCDSDGEADSPETVRMEPADLNLEIPKEPMRESVEDATIEMDVEKNRNAGKNPAGEEVIPMSVEEVLRDETPEEQRIRILNDTQPDKLTDEQKALFTYFARVPGMDQQILDALHGVYHNAGDKTSRHGNIAIMGGYGTGKSRLSEGIVRAICVDLKIPATKMARLDASELNKKDPAKIIAKLSGGFLLIERAGLMYPETIEKLSKAMDFRTDSLVLIIEDEKVSMRGMLNNYPEFAGKFETVISIPVFTNDELVTFARTYAKENGYRMDEMGVLALYTEIGNNQKEGEPMTITQVKEMVDRAIAKAGKGTRKLGRKMSGRHRDSDDRVILYEKDFE